MRVQRHSHEARCAKRCECGARYGMSAWKGLAFRGLQETGEGGLFLELRDCARCKSTLSLVVHLPQSPEFDPAASIMASGAFESLGLRS